jgi:hypothetical protein
MKPSLTKKQHRGKSLRAYVSTMIFASFAATYLDLILVGKHVYSFPIRPLRDIFTINIVFTLFVLPAMTAVFLQYVNKLSSWKRGSVIVILSMVMTFVEKISEKFGWFIHGGEWRHLYSLFGYTIFMWLVWKFYRWQLNEL